MMIHECKQTVDIPYAFSARTKKTNFLRRTLSIASCACPNMVSGSFKSEMARPSRISAFFWYKNRFWMKIECDTNWSSWIINIIINNSSASFTHLLDAHLLCDTMIVDQCSIQLECIQVSIVAASAIHGFLQEEAINNKVIRYTRLIINIYNSSRAHVIQTSGHALKHLAQVTCRQSSAIPITVAFTAKALLDICMQSMDIRRY